MLPKGVGVAKFDFTKTFRNQLFSRVRVLYHQYSITNHIYYVKYENTLTCKRISWDSGGGGGNDVLKIFFFYFLYV